MFSSDVFCLESLETLFSGVGAGRDAAERPSTQPKLEVTTSFEDRNNPEVKDGGSFLQSQHLGGGGRRLLSFRGHLGLQSIPSRCGLE